MHLTEICPGILSVSHRNTGKVYRAPMRFQKWKERRESPKQNNAKTTAVFSRWGFPWTRSRDCSRSRTWQSDRLLVKSNLTKLLPFWLASIGCPLHPRWGSRFWHLRIKIFTVWVHCTYWSVFSQCCLPDSQYYLRWGSSWLPSKERHIIWYLGGN